MLWGIDFTKFLSITYWFSTRPGDLSIYFERLFLFILFFCYLLYAVAKYINYKKIQQKNYILATFWRKIGTFWLTLAVSQTFLFFFRYESIPLLGGRFWFLAWLIGGLGWGIYLAYYFFKIIPQKQAEYESLKQFNQFLPKKKKK